jgi:hypothetical protein
MQLDSTELADLRRDVGRLEALLHEVLAAVRTEQLSPAERAVVCALHAVFGGAASTTAEIVSVSAQPLGDRPALRDALAAVAGDLQPQRVGQALASMAARGGRAGALRLVSPRMERGARLWAVETLRGYAPQSPAQPVDASPGSRHDADILT